jgi:hypothetical protein
MLLALLVHRVGAPGPWTHCAQWLGHDAAQVGGGGAVVVFLLVLCWSLA